MAKASGGAVVHRTAEANRDGVPSEMAGPHLSRLGERVHESSSVSILDGHGVVYVARVPARRIMRLNISVGTRFPAHETSMERFLLNGLGTTERARPSIHYSWAETPDHRLPHRPRR